MYTRFFLHPPPFFPAAVGLLSRSRLRGTRGARLYTTAQDWVPGGLRGACSGRSKSRHLASNRGVAFRGARAVYDDGKTTCQLFCPCKGQQHGSNNRLKLSSVLQLRTLLSKKYIYQYMRVWSTTVPCVVMMLRVTCAVCACVWICPCVTHASTRLCVVKDTYM